MQNKASLILKWLTNYRRFSTTLRFVQVRLEVVAININNIAALIRAGQATLGISS